MNQSAAIIKAARTEAGLTQTAAARLLHTTCRVWQQWEAGDRRMHPAFWELFRIKTKTPLTSRKRAPALTQSPSDDPSP